MNSHDHEFEELKNRIADSSVTDALYKNLSGEGGEPLDNKRFELIVGLMKNLENKVHQLTNQNKKMEEELSNNISNVKNDLEKTNLRNDSNIEKIEIITRNKEEMKTQQNHLNEEFLKTINDKLNISLIK